VNNVILTIWIDLAGARPLESHDVTSVLNGGQLETIAETEVGNLVLTSILNGGDLAFGTSGSPADWDNDAINSF
jgi:hypothetical protein